MDRPVPAGFQAHHLGPPPRRQPTAMQPPPRLMPGSDSSGYPRIDAPALQPYPQGGYGGGPYVPPQSGYGGAGYGGAPYAAAPGLYSSSNGGFAQDDFAQAYSAPGVAPAPVPYMQGYGPVPQHEGFERVVVAQPPLGWPANGVPPGADGPYGGASMVDGRLYMSGNDVAYHPSAPYGGSAPGQQAPVRAAPPPEPSPRDAPGAGVGEATAFAKAEGLMSNDIRSEADMIALRLQKTQLELERLRRQGDLIGESLRKQKQMELNSPSFKASRSPQRSPGRAMPELAPEAPAHPVAGATPPTSARSPPRPDAGPSAAAPAHVSPAAPSPAPVPPAPAPPAASPPARASPPAAQETAAGAPAAGAAGAQGSVIPDDECARLGLPPGSMYFDGSGEQIAMIQQQLEQEKQLEANTPEAFAARQAALAARKKLGESRGACKTAVVPDEEVPGHFATLGLEQDGATLTDVLRAYKRTAPRVRPADGADEAEFAALTRSFQVCDEWLRKQAALKVGELGTIGEEEEGEEDGSAPPADDGTVTISDVPPLLVYSEVFHSGGKHRELRVELGVSLEDLLRGHKANFEYERNALTEEGTRAPERCSLSIEIARGMRGGTTFVFECEGDDAPGFVPGDVHVILVLEPHARFVASGDDIATEMYVQADSVLLGDPLGPVLSLGGERLVLAPPAGAMVQPESVHKVAGQGLPLQHDPDARGDLYVKVHILLPPRPLALSEEQRAALKGLLDQPPIAPDQRHAREGAPEGIAQLEVAHESHFGQGQPQPPIVCAQQ